MRNRIRVFRQRNGLTLRELAESVGTTPQSVSRLETGNMTLSTEWLERFARALSVHPVDLLEGPGARDIVMLGHVSRDGAVREGRESFLTIDVPAESPVAVKLDAPFGDYRAGEVLIGDKLSSDHYARASGADCIVETVSGVISLRRALSPPGANGAGELWLVQLSGAQDRGEALSSAQVRWIAPLILRMSYIT